MRSHERFCFQIYFKAAQPIPINIVIPQTFKRFAVMSSTSVNNDNKKKLFLKRFLKKECNVCVSKFTGKTELKNTLLILLYTNLCCIQNQFFSLIVFTGTFFLLRNLHNSKMFYRFSNCLVILKVASFKHSAQCYVYWSLLFKVLIRSKLKSRLLKIVHLN